MPRFKVDRNSEVNCDGGFGSSGHGAPSALAGFVVSAQHNAGKHGVLRKELLASQNHRRPTAQEVFDFIRVLRSAPSSRGCGPR
jgi:hypothetical protein